MKPITIIIISFIFSATILTGQQLPLVKAEDAGLNPGVLEKADSVLNSAIDDKLIPGAVFLVLKDKKIAYRKAYGNRQLVPQRKPMTIETIFDMASLTKPISAATAMMMLFQDGHFRLLDKVQEYLPDFSPWQDSTSGEKQDIRLIHLLTHTSGLPAYAHPDMLEKKYNSASKDTLYKHIDTVDRLTKPGTVFRYSGLNFITMQRIIEKISGEPLAEFVQDKIFNRLDMRNTSYILTKQQVENCAATEVIDGEPLLGEVHDPMARIVMLGNSANAGLFSTADDLAIYAAMMLNNGTWNNQRILSPLVVKAFISMPAGYEEFGRGLGWDLNSAYASNQGDLLSAATYGHTGYTGTSIVIDPEHDLAIILLTNRVHPDDKGSVVRLRSIISNLVAASIN